MHADLNHARVQKGLPGFMISLVLASMKNVGLEIRKDLEDLAGKASVLSVKDLPPVARQTVARAIEKDGYDILKASNEDQLPALLAGVCVMFVNLQKRGHDVEENAMLVCLAIAGEATGEDEQDEDGAYGRISTIMDAARKMEKEARHRGYFSHLILAAG